MTVGRPRETSPEQAEKELRAAGYVPSEMYPGTVVSPWKARCETCGQERTVTLNSVRRGARCRHSVRIRVMAETADAEFRAAGYEPVDPYPGNVNTGRLSVCLACRNSRRPSLSRIRNGHRCKHFNNYAKEGDS